MAFAFGEFWDRLRASLFGSDLVPVSALVCGFLLSGICDHAGGGADGDRVRRRGLGFDLPQSNKAKSVSGDPVVVSSGCGAGVVPALSGRGSKKPDWFF